MGTRALVKIDPYCKIKVMSDGYVEGVGKELIEFLSKRKFVSGIPINKENCVNGMADLAAQVVAYLKLSDGEISAGKVYLEPLDENTQDHEYCYDLRRVNNKLVLWADSDGIIWESEQELPELF